MINKIFIFTIFLNFQLNLTFCQQSNSGVSNSNSQLPDKQENADTNKINFLFLGDIMSHDLQIKSAYNKSTGKYDFSTEFEHIQPIIKDVDAVIGNLEVTLAGPPYAGYPMFSSPDQMAIDIKNAGIKYLVTANNHINDRGLKGFRRTLDVLDSIGFKHTGTFRNVEDKTKRHPMIIDEKGWKIALFNYTYGINGGAYDPKMLINEVDSAQIINDLTEAKKQNFDAIIVFFHWGEEYKRNSNAWQQKYAKLCFENGANAVIGSHPHVVQEMEKYTFKTKSGIEKDALVVYSLGNYVANYGSWRYTNGGAMVQFSFSKLPNGQVKIDDQGYYLIWVYRKEKTDTLKTYYVLPVSQFDNDKMLTGEHLKLFNQFKIDMRTHLNQYNKNVNEYLFNKNNGKWEIKK
jgi:poly-gamma-glutamate synthesis protein (capsule biosynthesis protein)